MFYRILSGGMFWMVATVQTHLKREMFFARFSRKTRVKRRKSRAQRIGMRFSQRYLYTLAERKEIGDTVFFYEVKR